MHVQRTRYCTVKLCMAGEKGKMRETSLCQRTNLDALFPRKYNLGMFVNTKNNRRSWNRGTYPAIRCNIFMFGGAAETHALIYAAAGRGNINSTKNDSGLTDDLIKINESFPEVCERRKRENCPQINHNTHTFCLAKPWGALGKANWGHNIVQNA